MLRVHRNRGGLKQKPLGIFAMAGARGLDEVPEQAEQAGLVDTVPRGRAVSRRGIDSGCLRRSERTIDHLNQFLEIIRGNRDVCIGAFFPRELLRRIRWFAQQYDGRLVALLLDYPEDLDTVQGRQCRAGNDDVVGFSPKKINGVPAVVHERDGQAVLLQRAARRNAEYDILIRKEEAWAGLFLSFHSL